MREKVAVRVGYDDMTITIILLPIFVQVVVVGLYYIPPQTREATGGK